MTDSGLIKANRPRPFPHTEPPRTPTNALQEWQPAGIVGDVGKCDSWRNFNQTGIIVLYRLFQPVE